MSLQTWMQEYYPVKPNKRMTKRQAIEHPLRKWEGLTEENLSKHGCYKDWKSIRNDDYFGLDIDGESCALCVKYYYNRGDEHICDRCPLSKSLGNACDSFSSDSSPYLQWLNGDNPLPMIKALRKLLE